MRKLIVTEFVNLDGVMEAPGGEPSYAHTGWVGDFMGAEEEEFKLRETLDAEAHLLGRVTYESFAESWSRRSGPFADKINAMPKYVATTTLDEPGLAPPSRVAGDEQVVAVLRARERDHWTAHPQ